MPQATLPTLKTFLFTLWRCSTTESSVFTSPIFSNFTHLCLGCTLFSLLGFKAFKNKLGALSSL